MLRGGISDDWLDKRDGCSNEFQFLPRKNISESGRNSVITGADDDQMVKKTVRDGACFMISKNYLYILIADNSRAKIFRTHIPLESLEMVFEEVNIQGRKKPGDIYSDKAGTQQSGSGGFHSFAGERQSHEEIKFSKKLCSLLNKEYQAGEFSKLMLIAPPHFLGELRKHLGHECKDVLLKTIDKDLVNLSEKDIMANILEYQPELKLLVRKASYH